ncbi:IS3 family transposase [Arachnia propionica]
MAAAKTRPASARQLRDELLLPVIKHLHEENHSVYGVRKMHALLKRQGWNIGRDQTTRLCVWRGRAVWHGRRRCAPPRVLPRRLSRRTS